MSETAIVIVSYVVMVMFLLAHASSKWGEHRETAAKKRMPQLSLGAYLLTVAPARTLNAVVIAIGLSLVELWLGAWNPLTAFMCGWCGNSVVENLKSRALAMLKS